MGPIENVIQGFGQCCGFPIQVSLSFLHGTCTVLHKAFCHLGCALRPRSRDTQKSGQIDIHCVMSFACSVLAETACLSAAGI